MENNQINYFIWINRILTSLLSGVIGTVISLATYYLFLSILQISIAEVTSLSFLLFVIIIFSLFLGVLIFQILQNYFCHILEKEKYIELAKKMLFNLLAGITLMVLFTILGFVMLSQNLNGAIWSLCGFLAAYFLFGHLVREKENIVFSFCNIVGVSIGICLTVVMVLVAINQGLGLAIIIGFLAIPIVAISNSSLEFLGVTLKNLTNGNEEISDKTNESTPSAS